MIEYLEEVEIRKLYLKEGYSSMYAFCTEYLGYTEQEAYTRIQAMRLSRKIPEVKEKLQSGELSLSVAAKVQGFLRREDKIKTQPKMSLEDRKKVVMAVQNESVRSSEEILLTLFPHQSEIKPEKLRSVSENTVRLEINISKENHEKLLELKNLRGVENFEKLIGDLVDLGLNRWGKIAKASSIKKSSRKLQAPVTSKVVDNKKINEGAKSAPYSSRSRHIPVTVKRLVWLRDKGECQFRSLTGKQCREKFGLHMDHVEPFALGGLNSQENLRLLCFRHNLHRAKETFRGHRSTTGESLGTSKN